MNPNDNLSRSKPSWSWLETTAENVAVSTECLRLGAGDDDLVLIGGDGLDPLSSSLCCGRESGGATSGPSVSDRGFEVDDKDLIALLGAIDDEDGTSAPSRDCDTFAATAAVTARIDAAADAESSSYGSSHEAGRARIQREIEAQAEKVRLSFLAAGAQSSSPSSFDSDESGRKRRRTVHSVPDWVKESNPSVHGNGGKVDGMDTSKTRKTRASSHLVKSNSAKGRTIFQSRLQGFYRSPSIVDDSSLDGSSSHSLSTCMDASESSLSLSHHSQANANPSQDVSNSGNSSSPPPSGRKRSSIRELVGPMSALLSSVQRRSRTAPVMTLNSNSPINNGSSSGSGGRPISVSKNDVICGTGAITDALIGNRRFGVLVDLHARSYSQARTAERRTEVARSVVRTVRQAVPSGRFLRLDVSSGLWTEVGDREDGTGGGGTTCGAVEHTERVLRTKCGMAAARLSDWNMSMTSSTQRPPMMTTNSPPMQQPILRPIAGGNLKMMAPVAPTAPAGMAPIALNGALSRTEIMRRQGPGHALAA